MNSLRHWLPARNTWKSTVRHCSAVCRSSEHIGQRSAALFSRLPIFWAHRAAPEHPAHAAEPSVIFQFLLYQRKQPFTSDFCKEQGLIPQILSYWFLIWLDGFNERDPTLSVISSIVLWWPLFLKGVGLMESLSYIFCFLSLTPSLQPYDILMKEEKYINIFQ